MGGVHEKKCFSWSSSSSSFMMSCYASSRTTLSFLSCDRTSWGEKRETTFMQLLVVLVLAFDPLFLLKKETHISRKKLAWFALLLWMTQDKGSLFVTHISNGNCVQGKGKIIICKRMMEMKMKCLWERNMNLMFRTSTYTWVAHFQVNKEPNCLWVICLRHMFFMLCFERENTSSNCKVHWCRQTRQESNTLIPVIGILCSMWTIVWLND